MNNQQQIQSKFFGRKVRKFYELVNDGGKPRLEIKTETLERVPVVELSLQFEFSEGEEIYLNHLKRYTKIQKKTRDIYNHIIYNISYTTETIEDYDESIKKQYEELLKKWDKNEQERTYKRRKEVEIRIKNRKKLEQDYKNFISEKSKVKKDKTIIFKAPPHLPADIVNEYMRKIEMTLPMDCNLVISPFEVALYNGDDEIVVNNNVCKNSIKK